MKVYKIILQFTIFACLFTANVIKAQSPTDFFKALSTSDFSTIETYLAPEVDLCIKDQPQLNSKSQALTRLKNLFENESVKSVEAIHQGSSKVKSSGYKVAKLTTSQGVYRLFVYSEDESGTLKVKEIRIEKF